MNNKNEQLLLACKEGQIKKVISYLSKNMFSKPADIDFKDVGWHNFTPLHYCVSFDYRNDEIAKLLIQKGANVNAKDEFGSTTLLSALYLDNNKEIVELLLNKGADINVKNEKWETPLIIASEKNSCEVIKLLIDKGAHINIEGKNGDTPLINACKKGIIEIVEVLINAGADINLKSSNHKTPLVVAWENHHFVIVELLIQKGSDYNFLLKQLLLEISKQKGSASGSESAVKELILLSEIIKKHGLNAAPISLKPLNQSLERMEWAYSNAFDEDGSGRERVRNTAKIIRDAISTLENNPALTIIKDI
jgi:ankyrin repeat protein